MTIWPTPQVVRVQKFVPFQGASFYDPDQGLCPWTPLDFAPHSRYRFALLAYLCPQTVTLDPPVSCGGHDPLKYVRGATLCLSP